MQVRDVSMSAFGQSLEHDGVVRQGKGYHKL